MSLFESLGFENVEADPNALPDNKWAGEVYKSEYVVKKAKNEVAHVITYRVTEGDRAGAQRQEWFTFGVGPKYAEDGKTIVGVETPTMSAQAKPWYVKRWEDLGVPFNAQSKPEQLIGKKVTFGTKKNGEFINISFVELREPPVAQVTEGTAAVPGATPTSGSSVIGSL